jgi:hypothetical protein
MAEKTEITLDYLNECRTDKILPMLEDLREHKRALDDYVGGGHGAPRVYELRVGNHKLLPNAALLDAHLTSSVEKIRDELKALISELEGMDSRLQQADIHFRDVEEDAALTASQLAYIIDPVNASGLGTGSGNP